MLTMLKSQDQTKDNPKKTYKGITFVKLPTIYFEVQKDLHPSTCQVYVAILKYANFETQECYPSLSRISKDTGISKRQVIRCVKQLDSIGLITVKRAKGISNQYVINYTIQENKLQLVKKVVTPKSPPLVTSESPVTNKSSDKVVTPMAPTSDTHGTGTSDMHVTLNRTNEIEPVKENTTTIESVDSQVDLPEIKTTPDDRIKDDKNWKTLYNQNPSGVIALWVDHWKVHIGTSVNKLAGKETGQGKNIYNMAGQNVIKAGHIIRQAFQEYRNKSPVGVFPFNKGQAPTLETIYSAYRKLDAVVPVQKPVIEREETDLAKSFDIFANMTEQEKIEASEKMEKWKNGE